MDAASAEQRIADLEARLKYPGYSGKQLKEIQAIEEKEKLQDQKRAEAAIREKQYAIDRAAVVLAEIQDLVKSGKLRISVDGKKIASLKDGAIQCTNCKQVIPESAGLLRSLHERHALAAGDGHALMKFGAMFTHTSFECQACHHHQQVKMQFYLME